MTLASSSPLMASGRPGFFAACSRATSLAARRHASLLLSPSAGSSCPLVDGASSSCEATQLVLSAGLTHLSLEKKLQLMSRSQSEYPMQRACVISPSCKRRRRSEVSLTNALHPILTNQRVIRQEAVHMPMKGSDGSTNMRASAKPCFYKG